MLHLLYRALRPLLFALDAETAHHLTVGALRLAVAFPPVRSLARRLLGPRDPALATELFGRTLASPVGVAAGFDKDARAIAALEALGFGFVEVGTLTALPQPGNPAPRLFRLTGDRALVNRLGFNNRGAAAAVPRLRRHRSRGSGRMTVGVNIGRSKLAEDAVADYTASARLLAPLADYLVVNVSSPNTPGLRDLQAVERLRPVLEAVQRAADEVGEGAPPPLLVKIAPDLPDPDVDAVADLALELGLAGIVATNTTIGRAGLSAPAAEVEALGAGGLSGPPVRARALAVLRRLRARVGERLVLVAVGGIEDADDAWARIRAGATVVQLYTGFVYGGPTTAKDVALGLASRAREAGYARVQDAVGSETEATDRPSATASP
ncbi:MAG: quinone-dependent dihydroorotate dehydrogenase [Sandaracinaceae bacterium]